MANYKHLANNKGIVGKVKSKAQDELREAGLFGGQRAYMNLKAKSTIPKKKKY